MSATSTYSPPEGEIALSGPVSRPELGTLPIRGDLAHIALAGRYLVPHYIQPQPRRIGADSARLLCAPQNDSQTIQMLAPGTMFEALDFAGKWCWGCLGPDGPTGYVETAQLAPIGQ